MSIRSKIRYWIVSKYGFGNGEITKPSILVTVKISKGFKTWTEMAKSFEDEMPAEGAKIVWAAANPDETEIYCMMDVPDPEFMKTFGERPDVKKRREDAGADVSTTTVITQIGDYWLG